MARRDHLQLWIKLRPSLQESRTRFDKHLWALPASAINLRRRVRGGDPPGRARCGACRAGHTIGIADRFARPAPGHHVAGRRARRRRDDRPGRGVGHRPGRGPGRARRGRGPSRPGRPRRLVPRRPAALGRTHDTGDGRHGSPDEADPDEALGGSEEGHKPTRGGSASLPATHRRRRHRRRARGLRATRRPRPQYARLPTKRWCGRGVRVRRRRRRRTRCRTGRAGGRSPTGGRRCRPGRAGGVVLPWRSRWSGSSGLGLRGRPGVFHSLAKAVSERSSRLRRSRLRTVYSGSGLAAAAPAQLGGDAAADLGHGVVGEFHDMEMPTEYCRKIYPCARSGT